MAVSQKPIIGVNSITYAVLTDGTDVAGGTPSYGTIYSLPLVMELGVDKGSSIATLFADDGPALSSETIGEISVTMNLADIMPEDQARILGHTYSAGIIVEDSTDASPYVAIMGKILRDTGVVEYFTLPKVKFSKPQYGATTKGASIEYQTPVMEGRAVQLAATGTYLVKSRSDDVNATAATQTNWGVTTVVYSTTQDTGAITAAITRATTTTSFVFTKAGGGIITLTQANLTAATLPIWKAGASVAGTYVITNNGTATVTVIFTPTVAFGANYVTAGVDKDAVYDQNGVFVSQKSVAIDYT